MTPEQEALLRHPTVEGALRYWPAHLGRPADPLTPLAGVHKARLKWAGSTDAMRQESRAWLAAHGYGIDPAGHDPSAPQARMRPAGLKVDSDADPR